MRVRSKVAMPVLATLLFLVVTRPAVGGGWATVDLSSNPDGLRAGQPWVVDLTILQHGRTPLDGVKPAVRVFEPETDRSSSFVARPTGRTGVYRARVTFPAPGKWEYLVDDGFGQAHSQPPVTIADDAHPPVGAAEDTSAAAADPGSRATALAGALGIGLAAAGVTVALRRRQKRGQAHAGAEATPAGR